MGRASPHASWGQSWTPSYCHRHCPSPPPPSPYCVPPPSLLPQVLRSDVEWVASIPWLYCVLDEGHIIKSPKAKITLAAKRVNATHRCERGGGSCGEGGEEGARGALAAKIRAMHRCGMDGLLKGGGRGRCHLSPLGLSSGTPSITKGSPQPCRPPLSTHPCLPPPLHTVLAGFCSAALRSRTTCWSSGRSLTSSCPASWARSGSSTPSTARQYRWGVRRIQGEGGAGRVGRGDRIMVQGSERVRGGGKHGQIAEQPGGRII